MESSSGEQQLDLLHRQDFPKSLRLLSPKDYQHVFAQAQKFANRHWTFIVRPNKQSIPRLGLALSKKQLAKSVWRNRVKRIARESFRQHKRDLCGYDIVVLGRRGMEQVDGVTLAKSFVHLINKVRVSDLKHQQVKEQA
jgi:ribonuclease P protein component